LGYSSPRAPRAPVIRRRDDRVQGRGRALPAISTSMSIDVSSSHESRARRYTAWAHRRALAIIAAHVVLVAGAIFLIATRLPLYADFSYLLPEDATSVRDLRRLEARVKAGDSVLVLVQGSSPAEAEAAAGEMLRGARR